MADCHYHNHIKQMDCEKKQKRFSHHRLHGRTKSSLSRDILIRAFKGDQMDEKEKFDYLVRKDSRSPAKLYKKDNRSLRSEESSTEHKVYKRSGRRRATLSSASSESTVERRHARWGYYILYMIKRFYLCLVCLTTE